MRLKTRAWMDECPELIEIYQAQKLRDIIEYANDSIVKAKITLKQLKEDRELTVLTFEIDTLEENINIVLQHIQHCESSLKWARHEMGTLFFMN